MKYILYIVVFVVAMAMMLFAQKESQGISVTNGQFNLTYFAQFKTDASIISFLEGKSSSGTKERFGILFKSSQTKNAMIEIRDELGKILRSISIGEYIGKTKSDGVKFISSNITGIGRSSITIHEIKLPSGNIKLYTKALFVGDKSAENISEQIIISFSLMSDKKQKLSLRLLLPIEGDGELKNNGLVMMGKSTNSSLIMSIAPSSVSVELQKNVISLQSNAIDIERETPMMWFIAQSVSGSSVSAVKNLSSETINKNMAIGANPKIVVTNMLNKENAQPGDTVTFTLVCKNIGGADATKIQLSNPIPAGTVYLEGSANDAGTELIFEREPVSQPQNGTIKSIQWKLLNALKGGEEKTVSLKVIVQ